MRKLLAISVILFAVSCFAAKAESFLDLRYAPARPELPEGESCSDRLLDIYTPDTPAPAKGYPIVVFVHGGGYSAGDKARTRGLEPLFSGWLNNGYAVVSINYFLGGKYLSKEKRRAVNFWLKFKKDGVQMSPEAQETTDKASEDAALALQWVAKNAKKYKLDKKYIVLCGGSAGAMNSLFTAFVTPVKHPTIRGVINLWGALPDRSLIQTNKIAVLTLHGDADTTVPLSHGRAIQRRLEELGSTKSKLVVMPERAHAAYIYAGRDYMDSDIIPFLESLK